MTVAFDVDGTLYNDEGFPRREILQLYWALSDLGCRMIVWSGGGVDYAEQVVCRLGLIDAAVIVKGSQEVDLAIDDVLTANLGKVNLYVG